MSAMSLWERYKECLCVCEELDLTLDISRMNFDADFLARMKPLMHKAYRAMEEIEAGAIANVDERRRVGHYWLRAPERAPDSKIAQAIRDTIASIKSLATQIHSGNIRSVQGKPFTDLLLIGIGGSVLGPQFIADALGHPARDRMTVYFLDNTDPDGMERLFSQIGKRLSQTLTIVVSKSGSTPETRNGMMVTQAMYKAAGLDFAKHAIAVTGEGSHLEQLVEQQGWLARFPMWEWVGGRTSATSAVGLLPAALQGIDIDAFLEGAAACDAITRSHDLCHNPAALMALMWHYATRGRGERDMVVLPYKDRLMLLSRYLQQLVMESLGKAHDLDGKKVEQGIVVYGNKGSTDQHTYVQQLREGVNNFFVTFIEVLEDGGQWIEVEPGMTAGDYLRGFLLGTRQALYENGRESMTLTVRRVDARTVGILIALFERTVGLYAGLVNINAYHQPGVEAGKKAAATVLELQRDIIRFLRTVGRPVTAEEAARGIGKPETVETVFKVLEALAVNRTEVVRESRPSYFQAQYRWRSSGKVR